MPSRLITSIILQTMETNVRLAQNLAEFVTGVNGVNKKAYGKSEGTADAGTQADAARLRDDIAPRADRLKYVYRFGGGSAEGSAGMRDLLGGKGANLAEMCNLGLPVPPGFTITTDVCAAYYDSGRVLPEALKGQVAAALEFVGKTVGARFGDPQNPLLVSVRSGARASMPGMMDTVLNLGINDATVEALAANSGDRRFAYDSYRRFIQMYSSVVLGIGHDVFEDILENYKNLHGHERDTDLTADGWMAVTGQYKEAVAADRGEPFPQDIYAQLWGAISAVFNSWQNARAITYRRLHNIPDAWGTAVNVQAMVFGNLGDDSATGVAFTRNPSTGENKLYGEFLVKAQGEDVVAGIRTPQNLTEEARIEAGSQEPSLEALMPETFAEFVAVCRKLEQHYRDMQDIEFTIQNGKLWMLQTRSGKRTTPAALKIAVEMAGEGLISAQDAVMRIDPAQLDQLLHPTLDQSAARTVLATGLAASPGAACGEIVFNPDDAVKLRAEGKSVILVRQETSPDDINGMDAAAGILTSRGGMTSHAAVVARGWGRPCITGASSLRIDYKSGSLTVGGITLKKGDIITMDGSSGTIFTGEVPLRQPEVSGDFAQLMQWADAARRMAVRANAETPRDAAQARQFGAEGIGLCRTEHMFFEGGRIIAMREMIMAADEAGRRAALAKILPMQRMDFIEIFEIMAGYPVTIRLLDPPLHEFLPHSEEEIAELAAATGLDIDRLKARAAQLSEANPMLGHRGCRLAITYPEIAEMQARAIFEAAVEAGAKSGRPVTLEIMIPLVSVKAELDILAEKIAKIARDVSKEQGVPIDYQIGTMIELPRAALRAAEIAQTAEFFSFGTNDLTQTTFGLSRDDASSFLGHYMAKGVLAADPFVTLDQDGVGELVAIAAERGRKTRADIKLGICGEHGGDAASISFCEKLGLDYVSCSPYRVPVARLAAAQAAIRGDIPPSDA